jgi:hypothetical protein
VIDSTSHSTRAVEAATSFDPTALVDAETGSRSSVVAPLIAIIALFLALIWVVRLEATLPSIRVGASSATATGGLTTLDPGTYLAENKSIVLSGAWFVQTLGTSTSAPSSSTVTTTPGSSMTLRFYGTDLSMMARIGPESGKVHVSVDGQESSVLPADGQGSFVDFSASQAENQEILLATGLAHRDHTLRITSDGAAEVAISSFAISANTPFPWAFVLLYVALFGMLFLLIRAEVIRICRRLGWLV